MGYKMKGMSFKKEQSPMKKLSPVRAVESDVTQRYYTP